MTPDVYCLECGRHLAGGPPHDKLAPGGQVSDDLRETVKTVVAIMQDCGWPMRQGTEGRLYRMLDKALRESIAVPPAASGRAGA